MTIKLAVASLSSVKSSPLKVMRVTKNVVGLKVSEALKLLQFSNLSNKKEQETKKNQERKIKYIYINYIYFQQK